MGGLHCNQLLSHLPIHVYLCLLAKTRPIALEKAELTLWGWLLGK